MSADQVVTVARAQRTVQDEPVPARTIAITAEVPEWPSSGYVRAAKVFHRGEAERIHGALMASLPGGTIDALFALMAADRASVLRVPHWFGTDPLPVTGLRLYCWKHQAAHTLVLADVERVVYALGAMPELAARQMTAIVDQPCPLDVLDEGSAGELYQYVELCLANQHESAEWVDPETEAGPTQGEMAQRCIAVLQIHKPCHTATEECVRFHALTDPAECVGCGYQGSHEVTVDYPCATAQALGVAS